jgi:hypothetical protein
VESAFIKELKRFPKEKKIAEERKNCKDQLAQNMK